MSLSFAVGRAESPPVPAPAVTALPAPTIASPAPPVPAANTNVPGPKIEFATPVYDFGKTKSGEPVKYTYYFTNTGDQVLEVTHVQPSCGCTAAGEYTKRVEPGKVGTLPIQFNTANFNGQVYKTIAVTSTARNQATVVLQLRGAVWKPIEFQPAYSVLNISPDAAMASTVVHITNNLEEAVSLFEPHSTNPGFTADLKTNVPGKGFELTISGARPSTTGAMQGQIILKTSSTNNPTLTVPFWANVQPAVMVFPPQLTLPPSPLTKKETPTVTIQNNSTNLLTLSEPRVNAPGVEVELKETQPGRVYNAVFAFPEGFSPPQGDPVVFTAKSSNPQMPVIKVPIMQQAKPLPPPVVPTKPAATAAVPTAQVRQ